MLSNATASQKGGEAGKAEQALNLRRGRALGAPRAEWGPKQELRATIGLTG
jgi:hypothetical protein